MKLDTEPRLSNGPGLFAALLDWARKVVQAVNLNDDASTAAIAAAVALVAPPGLFAVFHRTAPPAGWIVADGSTIGNTGSGATRANVDTLPLFTVLWAYSDALVPILTSAGAGSTRGASAAADWAANKRMTVPDARDRVIRMAGPSFQANGAKLESTRVMVPYTDGSGTVGVLASGSNGVQSIDAQIGTSSAYSTWVTSLNAATPLQFSAVRVASLGMLGCFKL